MLDAGSITLQCRDLLSYSTATHGGDVFQFGKDPRHCQFGWSKHHPLVAATGLGIRNGEETCTCTCTCT